MTARTRAEALYAQHIIDRPGQDPDVDALCGEHPHLAESLRAVHSEWTAVRRIHEALVEEHNLTAKLRRFGVELDPDMVLEPEPDSDARSESAPTRMVQRLQAHAPQQSRYRVVDEVARGGMGAIFRVWDGDLRRSLAMKVALSFEASEGDDEETSRLARERQLGRFLEEAQVNGQLDHPAIVPVHELGVDPEGRVFFTMRLVKGRDLKAIFGLVREGGEGWTQTRALRVILKVCEAMAYAHDRGVVHRDLKPANVMVGRFGEVYVMDWGLAWVVGRKDKKDIRPRSPAASMSFVRTDRGEARGSEAGSPLLTMDGDVIGTPAYMSPEQARGELHRMGPRSDVYSLGAILYHLIAGHMPYAPPGKGRNAFAVWGLVQSDPPDPLHAIAKEAPAELVAICEKAMARDPKERYATTQELREDLQAYLDGHVVRAYRTGAVAEFGKWVQRNKGMAASIAAAVTLALGGLASTAIVEARAKAEVEDTNARLELANVDLGTARDLAQANEVAARRSELEAREAREQAVAEALEARRQHQSATRVVDFMVELFDAPDPRAARGELVTAKALLDRGAESITSDLEEDPLVRAPLMGSMGVAYRSLGLYEEARPLLEEALRFRREGLGEDHVDTLESLDELGRLHRQTGRYAEAELLIEAALAGRRRLFGPEDPKTLRSQVEMARLHHLQGRLEEAEPMYVEALDARGRVLGEDDPDTLSTCSDLALLYTSQRRFDEAEAMYERALAGFRRVRGENHPYTLTILNNLAGLYESLRRFDEAEPLLVEALEGMLAVRGEDHPDTLHLMNHLAWFYDTRERTEDAEPLYVQALEASLRVHGEDHADTHTLRNNLGMIHRRAGRQEEAEGLLRQALDGRRRVLGAGHADTLITMQNLAELLHALGRDLEAEALAAELLERTPRNDGGRGTRARLLESIRTALEEAETGVGAGG